MRSNAASVGYVFNRNNSRTDDWTPDGLLSSPTKAANFQGQTPVLLTFVLPPKSATLSAHIDSQPCVQTIVMPRLSVYKFKANKNEIQLFQKEDLTRLQVQLSSIGMLVSSLLNMRNPCSNTHNASNCPRTPQVPKTAESSPPSPVQKHAVKSPPNKGNCEQTLSNRMSNVWNWTHVI